MKKMHVIIKESVAALQIRKTVFPPQRHRYGESYYYPNLLANFKTKDTRKLQAVSFIYNFPPTRAYYYTAQSEANLCGKDFEGGQPAGTLSPELLMSNP